MLPLSNIPASLKCYILAELHKALPPPPDDTPETLEARDNLALLCVARLTPMNAAEAWLAVQAIGAEAHAMDALQAASRNPADIRAVGQCRAQSSSMTRQAMALRKELRIVQEERRAAEWQRDQERTAEAAERARAAAKAPGLAAAMPGTPEADPVAIPKAPVGAGREQPRADRRESINMGQYPIIRFFETITGQRHLPGLARPLDIAIPAARSAESIRRTAVKVPEPAA